MQPFRFKCPTCVTPEMDSSGNDCNDSVEIQFNWHSYHNFYLERSEIHCVMYVSTSGDMV